MHLVQSTANYTLFIMEKPDDKLHIGQTEAL